MTPDSKLGWITNVWVSEAEKVASDLLEGHPTRVIVVGNPAPTEAYTRVELIKMGMSLNPHPDFFI